MAKKKKKTSHTKEKLITAGALALGAYLLYGSKNAKQNRKTAKSWMLKAKAEVLEQAEKLKELDREDYERIIQNVEAKYKKLRHVDSKDLSALARELRGHWQDFEKGAKKKTKKTAKKITKKASPKKST